MLGDRPRSVLSLVLLAVQVAVAGLHSSPGLIYPTKPTTTTVVVFVAHLGPWWLVGFGATGLALAYTLWRRAHRQYGHLGCAVVWAGYTAALWYGALSTGGPILLAVLATGSTAMHLAVATAYADRHD